MPGSVREAKAIQHGTPAAAAKCIGPESGPRKSSVLASTAAVTRGANAPQRLSERPAQASETLSLTVKSSFAPTRTNPCSGRDAARASRSAFQAGAPQSFACIFVPGPQASSGRPVKGASASTAAVCSAAVSRRSQFARSSTSSGPSEDSERASRAASLSHKSSGELGGWFLPRSPAGSPTTREMPQTTVKKN